MTITRRRNATPNEAFETRTEPLVWSSCVVWIGHTDSSGYGSLRVNGRQTKAHRHAWERVNGPIPDGMFIDHTCWERSCVNVEHLRLATRAQNNRNRSGADKGRKHDLPRGVTRSGNGFLARVYINGRHVNAGTFPTVERATIAVKNCRAFYFGEYAGN
ncbi:HNH endonuclease signature motif containing protein [Brachybacterium sp. J153]|uniref:HNH endonuclease signature motif containing protein n=1 Tax=Brachybacterium sp. J153 TaxID=3116488 RepID=UPI003FA59EE3